MLTLFSKIITKISSSRIKRIDREIEKTRNERRLLEGQVAEQREAHEKRLGKMAGQKEKNDLKKADRILRSNPIQGDDALRDLRALSKLLSYILGVSDTGNHVREKEAMLARAADAALLIKITRARTTQKLGDNFNDKESTGQFGSREDEQYRSITSMLAAMVDDIRGNRSLDMLLSLNTVLNAIDRYYRDFGDSRTRAPRAKLDGQ